MGRQGKGSLHGRSATTQNEPERATERLDWLPACELERLFLVLVIVIVIVLILVRLLVPILIIIIILILILLTSLPPPKPGAGCPTPIIAPSTPRTCSGTSPANCPHPKRLRRPKNHRNASSSGLAEFGSIASPPPVHDKMVAGGRRPRPITDCDLIGQSTINKGLHTMRRPPFAVVSVLFLGLAALASRPARSAEDPTTIYRDEFGIPHIFAPNLNDAAYAIGYAQAEDRLEELLKNYRRATGTMAEVFGANSFREDLRQRVMRHAEISRASFEKISPKMRGVLESYQRGIKQFMTDHPEQVPSWAQNRALGCRRPGPLYHLELADG